MNRRVISVLFNEREGKYHDIISITQAWRGVACGFVTAGFLGLSAATSAQAAPVTAFDNFPSNISGAGFGPGYTVGNIFTAQESGQVTLVEAPMGLNWVYDGAKGVVQLDLYEWTGISQSNPFGALLGTSDAADVTGIFYDEPQPVISFTGWDTTALLTQGGQYALIARQISVSTPPIGTTSMTWNQSDTLSAPGDGGGIYENLGRWTWDTNPNEHTVRLATRVTVDTGDIPPPSPVPLPASLPLLAGGAALLAALGRRRRPE